MKNRDYVVSESLAGKDGLVTVEIQQIIDRCRDEGGGRVIVPAGEYRIASLMLYSDITLYLKEGAKLIGSADWRDYTYFHVPSTIGYHHSQEIVDAWNLPPHYFNAMITAVEAKNVAIIGEKGSEINGSNCFDPNGKEKFRGPMGMVMCKCSDVTLRGYTFVDSANWSHQLDSCKNVQIDHVTVLAGHDGFNVHHCTNVCIEDCELKTGDDCIAGYDVRNLFVKNCYMNTSCNAFRYGGVNLFMEKCVVEGPGIYPHRVSGRHNLLYAFEYYAIRGDEIRENSGNWKITDCKFKNMDGFIHYVFGDEKEHQTNRPTEYMLVENCEISGLLKTSEYKGTEAAHGSIVFSNVSIDFREEAKTRVFLEIDDTIRAEMLHVSGAQEGFIAVKKA